MNTVNVGFIILGLVIIPLNLVLAAAPIINDPVRPYEPLPADTVIEREQIYLGELTGDPHMYEVTLGEERNFTLTLLQAATGETVPFSFILVKDNEQNRGVREIGRLDGKKSEWTEYRDGNFAMRFKRLETYTSTLAPGVYRFEISTPENIGKYMLLVGTEANGDGYFTELANIRIVQKFFGYSFLHLLLSSYILYPLGIIIVLYLIYRTWSRKRQVVAKGVNGHA